MAKVGIFCDRRAEKPKPPGGPGGDLAFAFCWLIGWGAFGAVVGGAEGMFGAFLLAFVAGFFLPVD